MDIDTSLPHNEETRLRNIEAHLGIGKVDEDTGKYSVETHESLVTPEPDVPPVGTTGVEQQKSVAELEAELEAAKAREGVTEQPDEDEE